ncbi:hypothetical protein FB45DRAFT_75915 [Roridomyces roridus]|uniref:Mixed lineage kinase domain-containing protein n=1 Tax=Roridomyces roridus TaxID=1738132 RepID=A0AAD7FL98_9AGAR|nr:hypothetical protein FB45DRAFT_75915 [Roridomyces roridus]
MPPQLRKASTKDRILQHGTVACTLLKDIGNATNQPYLQAIASLSLIIMETLQRVRDNKDACVRMTERAYELVCAIINICRDSEAELAPAMVRSIEQFTDTLEKMLTFVRSQVRGGVVRRMLRSMEDADLIKDCNDGLKHALDVFGVQASIVAAMTMAEMQRDATQRHEELITILRTKRKSTRDSTSDTLTPSPRKSRSKRQTQPDTRSTPLLPASPKIFYGRTDQLMHVVNAILLASSSSPARITISGPVGIGKSALALAAAHSSSCASLFGVNRYWVDCGSAMDAKQLVARIAIALGLEKYGRKAVMRAFGGLGNHGIQEGEGKEGDDADKPKVPPAPALLVLDALDAPWAPLANRSDVEDFLSLLADLSHLTLIVTLRGSSRPRQIRWTRPFLPPLSPIDADAARQTFLDISDAPPEDAGMQKLLEIAEGVPGVITHLAGLASFEGCAALAARCETEGAAVVRDREERMGMRSPASVVVPVLGGTISEEPGEMEVGEGEGAGVGVKDVDENADEDVKEEPGGKRTAQLNSSPLNSSDGTASASASRTSIDSVLSGTTAVSRGSVMPTARTFSGSTVASMISGTTAVSVSERTFSTDSVGSAATYASGSTLASVSSASSRTSTVDNSMSGTTLVSIASNSLPTRMSMMSSPSFTSTPLRTPTIDSILSGTTLASSSSSSSRTSTLDSTTSAATLDSITIAASRTSTMDSMMSSSTVETTLSGTTAASVASTSTARGGDEDEDLKA